MLENKTFEVFFNKYAKVAEGGRGSEYSGQKSLSQTRCIVDDP